MRSERWHRLANRVLDQPTGDNRTCVQAEEIEVPEGAVRFDVSPEEIARVLSDTRWGWERE